MKKIIAMLLAVMMLASLGTAAFAEDKVTVEVIAAQYGTKTADWWVGFEEKFEAANADIDLVVEVVSWNDINTVVDTRIANEQQPDLNWSGCSGCRRTSLLLQTVGAIAPTGL